MENDFVINLDISDLNNQIESVSRAYTDLGTAIRYLSQDTKVRLNTLVASSVSPPIKIDLPGTFNQDVEHLQSAIKEAVRSSSELQNAVNSMSSTSGGVTPTGPGGETAEDIGTAALEQISPKMAKSENLVDSAENQTTIIFRDAEATAKKHEKRTNLLVAFVENEVKKTKERIKSILSNLPGQLSTGFVGAIIGCIAKGYEEMNRKRAEFGEMTNIFEGGVDKVTSAAARKADRWFWSWSERAQWYWGVGRKEVQAALKLMVDNGFRAEQMLKKFDDDLGRVGHNVVTLSIGLAKHYNYSTAEAMGDVATLVRDYGEELNDAGGVYLRMSAAGERASVGVRNFSKIVLSAAAPISQMGINAETVGVFVEKLLGYYKSMNLDARYAGHEVEGVAVDLMTAFSRLDTQLKLVIARDMYGRDQDAMTLLMRFSDGLQRASTGDDDDFLEQLVRSYLKTVVGGTSKERSKGILAIQGSLHVMNRTAALVWDVGDHLAKGGKLEDMAEGSRKALRRAFKTEGEQVSELFKTKRELISAVSEIGSGLMTILIAILATIILGLKSLYYTIAAPPPGENNRNISLRIHYGNLKIYKMFGEGWNKVLQGGGHAIDALGKSPLADAIGPLITVMNFDVRSKIGAKQGVGDLPSDSWDEAFGVESREARDARIEKEMADEEKSLKGTTGLKSVGKKEGRGFTTWGGLISEGVGKAVSSLLVSTEVGPDKPMPTYNDLNPQGNPAWIGEGPSPQIAPPPIDQVGDDILQVDVEIDQNVSPRMGTQAE